MMNSEFEEDKVATIGAVRLTRLGSASGGTCSAYTANLFGKKVFVKEIKPEFTSDSRMLAAFRKEAEIGFRLDHPNLPKYIYAEGVLPPERYVVQEFIDGQTLPNFIKEHPSYFQNRKNVERLIRELIDVIDYLHHNQIVHLDLKPDNIIISRIGTSLKLIDLGFCSSDFYNDSRGFTRGEMAPEGQEEPGARGAESDYYGIGKILTYIRKNTPRFPESRFKKLEHKLLIPEPANRLTSKDAVEKALKSGITGNIIWLIVFASLILVIIVAAIFYNRISTETLEGSPAISMDTIPTPSLTHEPKAEGKSTEDFPSETTTPLISSEPNLEPNVVASQTLSPQSYENLKADMARAINKNFAAFEQMLNIYLREKKFEEADYKTINDAYQVALHKTFDTEPYKSQYPDLSPSLIDDTMAQLLQEIEKKSWGPAYEKYVRQYQTSASGSSK